MSTLNFFFIGNNFGDRGRLIAGKYFDFITDSKAASMHGARYTSEILGTRN